MTSLPSVLLPAFRRLALAAAAGLLANLAQATPISASMGGQAAANFYFEPGTLVVGQDADTWATTPEPLSFSTKATSTSANGSTLNTFISGSGTWAADGNSGTVVIDYGWSARTHDVAAAAATVSVDPLYGLNWVYTFVADQTGTFLMNCRIVGTGSSSDPQVTLPMFGLQGFDIIAGQFMPLGVNSFDPTVSGQVAVAVQAGFQYTLTIRNGGNISGGLSDRDASLHAEFDWTLPGATQSVPDSGATAALLGGALGLVTLARRRVLA